MSIPTSRTDTGEFFSPEMPTWSKDVNRAFGFRSHSDAEVNARLILDRLNDLTNRRVGLKCAKAEVKNGGLVVGERYQVNVCRVA
jgi:hypothetical protein